MVEIKSVFKHELVPKHEILNEGEAKEMLEVIKTSPSKLPKILSTDPAAVELGARPGNIIRVIRRSPTAGETKYYRVVIRG